MLNFKISILIFRICVFLILRILDFENRKPTVGILVTEVLPVIILIGYTKFKVFHVR